MKKLFYLLMLLVFFACSNEDGSITPTSPGGNGSFATSIPFVRLQNDSTKTAGTLEITSPTAEVDLKWNVKPEFNIDTTVTSLKLSNGRVMLPIKWNKQVRDGIFAPTNRAFSGGVQIIAGEQSKYIPIVWADEIDSVYYSQNSDILTRSGETIMPRAVGLEIHPSEIVYMDYDNDSSNPIDIHIDSEFETGSIERKTITPESHIDVDAISQFINDYHSDFKVQWNELGAPDGMEFAEHALVKAGKFSKYFHIMYDGAIPTFQYITCIPSDGSVLSAMNAVVVVKASTNMEWSLTSGEATISPVTGEKTSLGLKTLAINIGDNPGKSVRNVTVEVKNKDGVKKTLHFTQQGRESLFTVNSVTPEAPGPLLASGADININVTTDNAAWWAEINGVRTLYEEDETNVTCAVGANPGTTERNVTLLIGYGNVIVRQIIYNQLAGNSLVFNSILPVGNIPVQGSGVTLKFTGEYQGAVTVRAYLQSTPDTHIAESAPTTNKTAVLVIPDNFSSLTERTIIFKYQKENDINVSSG